MVVGFNHNIGYKGELFHVQTEDSGLANPHIITLLYRGGTILASAKTSYADIVKTEQLELVVESIMKEQHKNMMRRLKAGEFDARIFPDGAPQSPDADPATAASAPTAAPPIQTETSADSFGRPKVGAPPAPPTARPTASGTPISAPTAANKPTVAPTAATTPAAAKPAATASAAAGQQLAASVKQQLAAAFNQRAAEKGKGTFGATPQNSQSPNSTPPTGTPNPPTKRSLDEVILDYLITGEEK